MRVYGRRWLCEEVSQAPAHRQAQDTVQAVAAPERRAAVAA